MTELSPMRVEYDAGNDIFGRRVSVIYDKDYCGRRAFSIVIHPANQRDDGHQIHGCLTRDNLIAMAKAAENHK